MDSILHEIHRDLLSLYFLDSKDIKHLMEQLTNLPEQALTEILGVIKDSKDKQKNYFSKIKKVDPDFFKNLENFLAGHADTRSSDSIIPKF